MTETIALPFTIGATMYAPGTGTEQIQVNCPVCFGNRRITVILGDGEHVSVPCEGCGIGFSGPRGFIDEWVHAAKVEPFVIAGIERYEAGDPPSFRLRDETGATADYKDLCSTEKEALIIAEQRVIAAIERNMETRQHKRRSVEKKGWSVLYHRKQIADLERQLEWHRAKVRQVKP